MSKRKRPDSKAPAQSMTEQEKILYNLIQSKQDLGIWSRDMKRETRLPDNVVDKSLKSLLGRGLIKEVVNVQFKGRKHFLASEFEPSPEITGGQWYNDQGSLDSEFINFLKDQCLKHIRNLKVSTVDTVADAVRRSRVLKDDYSSQQIGDIVRALVLDNDVIEMRSNGLGEFASIPTGRVCYKCRRLPDATKEHRVGAMASIPCGVCPRIAHCTPGGIISPTTCEYYRKWLDF
ncbi:DNA-directed RNA polymerase III subunit rpc6 [Rhodamnia argentea]|uniref:DNA-directed RNA polymerase III subunit rpc6 n=1 Tax=Rhodamnia argentea TaxID=178133 RepID=A0A8B8NYI9_9MYRT|nr:DNA-directed RNA polymerase III subunit rpc6 [Rhodamnia argentea]XP_048140171.1 DNA-directed RNA polymerase III subunit rpc6 [Rhodamnia argentea]